MPAPDGLGSNSAGAPHTAATPSNGSASLLPHSALQQEQQQQQQLQLQLQLQPQAKLPWPPTAPGTALVLWADGEEGRGLLQQVRVRVCPSRTCVGASGGA